MKNFRLKIYDCRFVVAALCVALLSASAQNNLLNVNGLRIGTNTLTITTNGVLQVNSSPYGSSNAPFDTLIWTNASSSYVVGYSYTTNVTYTTNTVYLYDRVTVSGAGTTNVNGTYWLTNDFSGFSPNYILEGSEEAYLGQTAGDGFWYLYQLSTTNTFYYTQHSDLHDTAWVSYEWGAPAGELPAPTMDYGIESQTITTNAPTYSTNAVYAPCYPVMVNASGANVTSDPNATGWVPAPTPYGYALNGVLGSGQELNCAVGSTVTYACFETGAPTSSKVVKVRGILHFDSTEVSTARVYLAINMQAYTNAATATAGLNATGANFYLTNSALNQAWSCTLTNFPTALNGVVYLQVKNSNDTWRSKRVVLGLPEFKKE